jgi:hypothetical protein
MADLILTTFDWVPEAPRGYVRDLRVRWALEGCAAPGRSIRRAGEISCLSRLCRARHGPPVLREGTRRPDGAFCRGGLSDPSELRRSR